jgi:hypothetical protein
MAPSNTSSMKDGDMKKDDKAANTTAAPAKAEEKK